MAHPTAGTASQLRARAEALAAAARQLDDLAVERIRLLAGDDTWCGPTADRCHDDLGRAAREVAAAVDELRHGAATLRRHAEEAAQREMLAGRS